MGAPPRRRLPRRAVRTGHADRAERRQARAPRSQALAAASAVLGDRRRRAPGDVRGGGPGGRFARAVPAPAPADDAGAVRDDAAGQHRRLGSAGRGDRLGLRRGRARRDPGPDDRRAVRDVRFRRRVARRGGHRRPVGRSPCRGPRGSRSGSRGVRSGPREIVFRFARSRLPLAWNRLLLAWNRLLLARWARSGPIRRRRTGTWVWSGPSRGRRSASSTRSCRRMARR